MGGKGRRRSRSRERPRDHSSGYGGWYNYNYNSGKGRWNGGYHQSHGTGKGYGKPSHATSMSHAAYLVHELQELERQQQQEAQATSLLQRFVGNFSQVSNRETQEPGCSTASQSPNVSRDPPSWLKGLLDGLASKFGAGDSPSQVGSMDTSGMPNASSRPGNAGSTAANNILSTTEPQELLQLRQELAALKEEKIRSEQQAEKDRLQSDIKALRDSISKLPVETSSAEKPDEEHTVLQWLSVDVEQWDLDKVLISSSQQKAWISGVRPSTSKGWTRSPVPISTWLSAEKLRLSDDDLNSALQKAGLQKATALTRDLHTLRLLVKVLSQQTESE